MSNNRSNKGCSGCFTVFMVMILIVIGCMLYVNLLMPEENFGPGNYGDEDSFVFDPTDTGDDTDPADSSDETEPSDSEDADETAPPDDDSDDTEDSSDETTAPSPDPAPPADEDDDSAPQAYQYWYNELNDTEKIVYNTMLAAIKAGKSSCTFKNIDYDEYGPAIRRAIYAVTYDHPTYFWVTNGYQTEYYDRDGTTNDEIKFMFDYYEYWDYTMSPDKYINQMQTEIDKVVVGAKNLADPFDQALYVHDYLVHHAEYDHDALAEAKKTIHSASAEYIYSAYGCLVNKKTVCAGYAEAFQLIMNELGVNCTAVVGDAGGPHEWNLIELDGQLYYIDVTWDDADRKNDSGVFIYTTDSDYEYMCITSDELGKTHTPDNEMFNAPVCNATKYNYFRYMNYFVETYDFATVSDIVCKQAETKKIIAVQFANSAEYQKAVNDIITANNGFNIPVLEDGYRYIDDDVHLILKFFLE